MRDQPVGGGEIDADLPLLGADLVLHRRDLHRGQGMGLGHAPREIVDASHAVCLLCALPSRSAPPARPCPDGRPRRRRARRPRRRREAASASRRAARRSGGHCTSAARGRRRPASARRRTGSVRRAGAASASSASKPSTIQWRYQSSRAAWSTPIAESRFSTRRLLSGWMSAAMVSASARTWLRVGRIGRKQGRRRISRSRARR